MKLIFISYSENNQPKITNRRLKPTAMKRAGVLTREVALHCLHMYVTNQFILSCCSGFAIPNSDDEDL